MSSFAAPLHLPPTADDAVDALAAQVNELRYLADHVMETPVVGPRGQNLTPAEALARAEQLGEAIDIEEAQGSLRHHRVSLRAKALMATAVVVVDFPIMLWLASSIFNVDWGALRISLPLVISAAISLLATGGAAALHHIGHDQRQNKDHRRHLDKTALTIGSKISLLAVAVLVVLISVVAFTRVWTEGLLSGLDSFALLMAGLVATVMLISAWLIFWTAFRDGSPQQDDLAFYTRVAQHHLTVKRGYEQRVNEIELRIEIIRTRASRANSQDHGVSSPPRCRLAPGHRRRQRDRRR